MGRKSIKENKNIYFTSREEAGLTRAQASEKIGYISESRIEKIESGYTNAQPEDVLAFAQAYKKPSLCNYYCSHECRIGQEQVPEIKMQSLSEITLSMLASINSLYEQKSRIIEIAEDGKIHKEVFPKGTIVIEKAFLNPNDDGRRRFTIAHEAAHFILDRFIEKANFNTVFDKEEKYSVDELKAIFAPSEYQVDRLAAALLMPTYLFNYNYAMHFPRNTIKVYGSSTISVEDDVLINMFANSMRVSRTAMMIRLKNTGKFEYCPMDEYVSGVGADSNAG